MKEKCPPVTWPELGSVQFSEYSTRYRAGLDLVLKNIDCFVKAGERVNLIMHFLPLIGIVEMLQFS